MKKLFASVVVMVFGMVLAYSASAAPKKAMKNFRFHFLWQPAVVNQVAFSERDFFLFENRQLLDYYGNWWWYGWGKEIISTTIGTQTQLDYSRGDLLALRKLRTFNSGKTSQGMGFGLEFRPFNNLWISISYQQTPSFFINSTEEFDYCAVERWDKTIEYDLDGGKLYVYFMQLHRVCQVKSQHNQFQGHNAQIAAHWEFGNQFRIYPGAGLDIMYLARETESQENFYTLYPFSGWVIERFFSPREERENKTIFRPFGALGLSVSIKNLELGCEGKHVFGPDQVSYNLKFILPSSRTTWDFKLKKLTFDVFLKFAL